ncbi:MAG: FAD-dependent oxidoreductase, partial [Ruminococcus sp.]|nr:FAD-dependent oxidoreductase [Ruminococcus sp.]
LVIGGGIAGVLTACFLSREHINVVLVEASSVCSGQTRNTTAKITSQHGVCYSKITDKFSFDTALKYARANEQAIDDFEKLIDNLKINCDFERVPSYLYSLKETRVLEKEFLLAKKCSIDATLTNQTELPFDVKLALCYKNQAQFNPYPFISKLSDYISVFENTRVLKVEDNIAYCDNAKVKAKKIVFATHYPIVNFPGMYFTRMHQSRSYVLAVENAVQMNGMYYCADKGGLSFRSFRDLLLVSGESHRTGESPSYDVYESLIKCVKQFYPDAVVRCRFSAQDSMSPDSLPYAGQYSKSKPDWYVLTGFSKWGMSNSMLCSKLVSDMIIGNKNELEKVLSPSRFNSSTVIPVLNEVCHAVKGLSETAFYIPRDFVKDIERGEAKVVIYSGKRCGVYRSKKDELFAVSVRCPHLGCALKFNKTEKTWECPCHGSRFSYKGELLDSPSQISLKTYH